jgi:hypothetical protein
LIVYTYINSNIHVPSFSFLFPFRNRQVETNWYVARIVVFFNFQFLPSGTPSTYALIEPMAINGVASFDLTIPRAKAYSPNNKKYAVINVGQIDGCVGLLTDIDCTEKEKQSRRIIQQGSEKSFKFVIRAGRAFDKNLGSTCGKVSNLFVTRKQRQ